MAKEVGVHPTTISRIWRAHGLQPHRIEYFKLSTDPHSVEKLRDVVGLYVDPPERAVVFAFDEKSQTQAVDRTQPGLPLKDFDRSREIDPQKNSLTEQAETQTSPVSWNYAND